MALKDKLMLVVIGAMLCALLQGCTVNKHTSQDETSSIPRLDATSASTGIGSQAQAAISTQDKYALRIPNGLAFSEFRGYESWQFIAVSHHRNTLAAILGNPVMISAFELRPLLVMK